MEQNPAQFSVFRISSVSSVAQSCLTLCNPLDCRTPGFPAHHQLPELTQTHVHQVGDAIQPSHPLSSPSPLSENHQLRERQRDTLPSWADVCVHACSFASGKSGSLRPYGLYSPPVSIVHGILQARKLEWVAVPSSRWCVQDPESVKGVRFPLVIMIFCYLGFFLGCSEYFRCITLWSHLTLCPLWERWCRVVVKKELSWLRSQHLLIVQSL